jgi:acyl-coenzyme A synthetase/AMP-(fatty) acid ligase
VATVDEEGNFSIVDRIKELIKYKVRRMSVACVEVCVRVPCGVD